MWIVCSMCENNVENQDGQCPICGFPLAHVVAEEETEALLLAEEAVETFSDSVSTEVVSNLAENVEHLGMITELEDMTLSVGQLDTCVQEDICQINSAQETSPIQDAQDPRDVMNNLSIDRLPGLCLASQNLLRRFNILTVGALQDLIASDGLRNLRGLGQKNRTKY